MKPIAVVLLCLALGSQGRVLQPSKESLDIPVEIVKDQTEPQALPLIQAEEQPEPQPQPQQQLEKEKEKEQPTQAEPQLKESPLPVQPAEPAQPAEQTEPAESKTQLPEAEPELKTELPKISAETAEIQTEAQPEAEPQPILKSQPIEDAQQPQQEAEQAAPAEQTDAVQPQVRQATQATPAQQSTTQQNFVQQLIQNSPIGQFLNQFNGQQQPQPSADAADASATPAPTVPGFLNPGAAITSAQNAVQNAAQSVVNTTTQAFQGIQQFASNLGTQFQNTLSGLTGQQQQQQQPTTVRPPGPIQAFVNNVFGGGNNATGGAAAPQQQQPGPLQGIINFLGGNRPQNAPAASAAPAVPITEAPPKPAVDDKLDAANEVAEQASDSENEVRSSAENIDDSFEEAVPANEVIVVNDDASGDAAALPGNSVDSEPQPEAIESAAGVDAAVAL